MALFSIARPDTFATWQNWQSIFNLGSVVMVIAAALTVPMIMGDFDLSVGYNAQLLGAVAIVLVANVAISTGFTIVLTLLLGAAIGATIGAIVAWSKVSAFVITLGAGTVMLGIELRITHDGRNIFEGIPASYAEHRHDVVPQPHPAGWITFGVYAVLWFLTEHTVVGRYMAAIGGNQEAARLSGIKVEIVRMLGFVIVGLGAALAGIILTSQAQSVLRERRDGLPPAGVRRRLPRRRHAAGEPVPHPRHVPRRPLHADDPDRPDHPQLQGVLRQHHPGHDPRRSQCCSPRVGARGS